MALLGMEEFLKHSAELVGETGKGLLTPDSIFFKNAFLVSFVFAAVST